MSESIELSAYFPVEPRLIYEAWLSSQGHSAMTGSHAQVDPALDGSFVAWDGYIEGRNLELVPYSRIVQAWRTTEFPPGSPDSVLEISFQDTGGCTSLTLRHANLPDGQGQNYYQGWLDYYFEPMQQYFHQA